MSTLVNGRPRPSTIGEAERNRLNDLYFELFGKVGIRDAIAGQTKAMAEYPDLLAAKREAEAAAKVTGDELDDRRTEAGWEIDERFKTEANKTWLDAPWVPERRSYTADEKKEYKAYHVNHAPQVEAAADLHRASLEAVEQARDAIAVAERRLSAAKYEITATTQMLSTLTTALHNEGTP